ncbi:hypothetical protein M2G40_20645 [Vibrio vulnificus]|nr:hypothetical protein [Vibrio vulnificus]
MATQKQKDAAWNAARPIRVRISVIAIARFGLFRSPDPAVFLSSYFYSK